MDRSCISGLCGKNWLLLIEWILQKNQEYDYGGAGLKYEFQTGQEYKVTRLIKKFDVSDEMRIGDILSKFDV